MKKLNRCYIEIELEFGCVNDKTMSVVLHSNGNDQTAIPELINGQWLAKPKIYIELPTAVKLSFSGKDHITDVIFDHNGNIIKDLYVKILSVNIDGFKLNEKFIHQRLVIDTTDGQSWTTSYIGFNGNIIINMPEKNVFLQYYSFLNR